MRCKTLHRVLNVIVEVASRLLGALILAALFLSVISVTSCSRYCATHYPPQIIIKDSIRTNTEVKYRDSLIYVPIPGKVVKDSTKVEQAAISQPISKKKNAPNKVHKELDYCSATAWIENDKLFLLLEQKDSLLAILVKNAIKESVSTTEHYRNELQRVTIENKEKQRLELIKGRKQGVFGILALLVIIAGIIWYFKRR